jgi:DNA mismatch repair protein MutL
MARIRVLSDHVANQIAAGEVIERPAAVVKELLENSLDAGASRVDIEFRHGGKSYIRVEDNGSGMSPDEALLCLERHATSKITSAEDLRRVLSFGFRGEALPSIASVARFTLRTRPADAANGTEVLVLGGKLIHQRDCGMSPGTRIEVAQLFHNVPARRKFLRKETTETAHIIHLVRLYAVAHPEVAFSLWEGERPVFQSPVCTRLEDRVREIWGRQVADDLVTLPEKNAQGMKLFGLIGRPGQGRATRHELVTLVNGRPVDSRTLAYAIIESYHGLLPKARYPLAFVFLEIDPDRVDVNVHPAKREVRFSEEPAVRQFVITHVLDTLRGLHAQPEGRGAPTSTVSPVFNPPPSTAAVPPPAPAMTPAPARPQPVPPSAAPSRSTSLASSPRPTVAPAAKAPSPATDSAPGSSSAAWRMIGFFNPAQALFASPGGLVLLDLRAAHQRVWYEAILDQAEQDKGHSQPLLFPIPLELDPLAASVLEAEKPFLADAGFVIEAFGRNFYRVEALPAWLATAQAETFIRDWVGLARQQGASLTRTVRREQLAREAVQRSVAEPLPTDEPGVQRLLKRLFACRDPLASPLGKPTFIEWTHGDIERRFGR